MYILLKTWVSFCSSYHNKNAIKRIAYKQQIFISHSSGIWEVQEDDCRRFSVWWQPAYSLMAIVSLKPCIAEVAGELCGISFLRALISFMRAPPSWPRASHRSHLWIQPHWVLGFNTWIWRGDTNIQSLAVETEYGQALTCYMLEIQVWKYMSIFIYFPKEKVARCRKKNMISLQNLH